jgi:hypothetical protein
LANSDKLLGGFEVAAAAVVDDDDDDDEAHLLKEGNANFKGTLFFFNKLSPGHLSDIDIFLKSYLAISQRSTKQEFST